jgi:hypothetical protein
MSYTSQLKPQVDLPVWEWMRFAPANTVTLSSTCRDDRYIYYTSSSVFWRYDTYSDGWQQLATPVISTTNVVSMYYSRESGHNGRAISSGGGNNTIKMAALNGACMVGYKIRIVSGTGAGQERTITAVSAPTIEERGVAAGNFTDRFQDGSAAPTLKAWRLNQWRDYQGRGEGGTVPGVTRKILFNGPNLAPFSDPYYAGTVQNWGAVGSAVAANSFFQFESQIVTVDSNWTTNPDSSSKFVILSGGIWMVSSNAASTFFTTQYYDVLADVWFQKTSNGMLFTAALGTEINLIGFSEAGGAIATGTATSGAAKSLTNSALSLATDTYANFQIRITAGTGIGQTRTILYNTASTIYITRAWDTNPSSDSVYQIWPDTDKLYLVGSNMSSIAQYSIENDQWSTGRQYEGGFLRSGAATASNGESFAIASIAKATGGITVLNATPTAGGTGYLVDQLLTLAGGSGGVARITGVAAATGAVTSVILETCGSGYTSSSSGIATTVNTTGGSGCTLAVTTAAEVATVTFATNIAPNFKIGESVTISGASAANYNGVKTVLAGTVAGNAPFAGIIQYAAPADAAPTFVAHTGTMMVDSTKNWVVNEHVGKIIQITSVASPSATGFARKITANTANTITWVQSAGTLAVFARYAIIDEKCFMTDMSGGARFAGGRSGVATGGTTTTLVDSTKNWPINYWSNTLPTGASNTARKVRIIAGTGVGNELTITNNTATTLTFATQSFTPDSTTLYQILDGHGQATGGSTTTLIDTTQNWGTNVWLGKRVRFVAGDGTAGESTITGNTQTTLTFAATNTISAQTAYSILEPIQRAAGASAQILTNSTITANNNRIAILWRGGGVSEVGRYNFNSMQYDALTASPFPEALTTGSMYAYDGADRIYFHSNATGRIMYYDVTKNTITNSGVIPYGMGTAIVGNRMEIFTTVDGLKYLYIMRHGGTEMWRTLLFN